MSNTKLIFKSAGILILLLVFTVCESSQKSASEHTAKQKKLATAAPSASVQPAVPMSDILKRLQGAWVSNDDTLSQIKIEGDTYISVYNGEELSREQIEAFENCPGFCSTGTDVGSMSCYVVKGEFDATCFAILHLDKDVLQVALIGGRGNTITYHKQ